MNLLYKLKKYPLLLYIPLMAIVMFMSTMVAAPLYKENSILFAIPILISAFICSILAFPLLYQKDEEKHVEFTYGDVPVKSIRTVIAYLNAKKETYNDANRSGRSNIKKIEEKINVLEDILKEGK